MQEPELAYISFDVVPAPKGAAIHIREFTRVLADTFGAIALVTVSPSGDTTIAPTRYHPNVIQTQLPATGKTLIDRALTFRHHLQLWLRDRHFKIIQIRSIYEGLPVAIDKSKYCDSLIFEVNGLPSIELKYRYPNIASDRELRHKINRQEKLCLQRADVVITPSQVTKNHLISRHIEPEKIRVIPNGIDPDRFHYQCPEMRSPDEPFRLIYFGILAKWQGVDLAVRAVAQLTFSVELTIIGKGTNSQVKALKKRAEKLGIRDRIIYQEAISQPELVAELHQADAVVIPLTPCDRNTVQGCCPLKVLEAMATGVPIIASDLPVVRELATPGEQFFPAKPGSVTALVEAIAALRSDFELRKSLSISARKTVEKNFTWQQSGQALIEVYRNLI
ncbi:MAG: glycosyltransferase family 4 protein [Limnospira sp.]